jgi:hypothetical protein
LGAADEEHHQHRLAKSEPAMMIGARSEEFSDSGSDSGYLGRRVRATLQCWHCSGLRPCNLLAFQAKTRP